MKKKMKTKTPPPKKAKVVHILPAQKVLVLKKFKAKDAPSVTCVIRMADSKGFAVATFSKGVMLVIREFPIPDSHTTEIPENLWRSCQRELAIWYARYWAHSRGMTPSTKKERGRRRKIMKRLLPAHQEHMDTKATLHAVSGQIMPPMAPPKPKINTFVFIYDPKERLGETTFRVHTAGCVKLDRERRTVCKRRKKGTKEIVEGASWVVEANDPMLAVQKQVEEFDEDDKGYDATDFEIHNCGEHHRYNQ